MSTLIVSEVNTLLYAYGIPNVNVTKIVFIEMFPERTRIGERPFDVALSLAREIAILVDVEFEYFSTSEAETVKKLLGPDSIIELSIVVYFKLGKKLRKGSEILSGAIEYGFVNSPSVFRGLTQPLKLRIDMHRKVFIPLKINKFYTLSTTARNFHLIKNEGIDLDKAMKNSKEIVMRLFRDTDFSLGNLGSSNFDKTLIVLPRPKEYQGTSKLNELIIRNSFAHAKKYNFDQIVVKNHPMDNSDYSYLQNENSIPIIYLNGVKQRMFPLELLIHFYRNVSIYGVFSTATYALRDLLCEVPHIYLPTNSKSFQYTTGTIINNIDHVPHYCSW
jgi:hypothetical protein